MLEARGGSAGRRLVPLFVPVVLVLVLLALHHSRTIYTSDSTAQQSIVRTWLDVGHGITSVPRDTWALKVPLYLLLENLPLAPLDRLLAAVLVLNGLTFLMLGWAARRLAGPGSVGFRGYDVAVPLAWLATLGGGIASNRMLPNYRNIELGLCFVMLAVAAGYLAGSRFSRRRGLVLGTGAAVLLGALWFDDPYVGLLVAAPLAVAAVAWFLARERDRRLLHLAAVIAASFLVTSLSRLVARWFGIHFADADRTLAVGPAALAQHLGLLRPGIKGQLGIEQWHGGPADLAAQALVVIAFAGLLAASLALAWRGWRQGRFVEAFVGAHWPLVVAGFLVSWHTQDASAGRYLVLAVVDVAMAAAVLLPRLRIGRPGLAAILVGVLAVGAVLNLGTGAATAIDAARRPSAALPHQEAVVQAVERAGREHGAVKGYAPFWSANITSYLAGPGTTATELVCRHGRLGTRQWLSDTARLTRPASAVFLIWDPEAIGLAGCPASVRDAQLGPPIATYPLTPTAAPSPGGSADAVLVYAPDVETRLLPGGGA